MTDSVGVFRAVVTRDGEARSRDGQHYYAMNRVSESGGHTEPGGELFEIQFADGAWMLVRAADLVAGSIEPPL